MRDHVQKREEGGGEEKRWGEEVGRERDGGEDGE